MTANHQQPLPTIVLVHGLFMSGVVMVRLKQFFKHQDYPAEIFSYHTLTQSTEQSAERLADYIEKIDGLVILVCHSLGGLLAQKAIAMLTDITQVKKVVTLGTPWQGASVVTFVQQYRLDVLMGKSLATLLPKHNEWQWPTIPLGSIAGHSSMGARLLFARGKNIPSDGTVTIEETKIKGMTDHTILPVSHTGLIFSDECAKKILQFIKANTFTT